MKHATPEQLAAQRQRYAMRCTCTETGQTHHRRVRLISEALGRVAILAANAAARTNGGKQEEGRVGEGRLVGA